MSRCSRSGTSLSTTHRRLQAGVRPAWLGHEVEIVCDAVEVRRRKEDERPASRYATTTKACAEASFSQFGEIDFRSDRDSSILRPVATIGRTNSVHVYGEPGVRPRGRVLVLAVRGMLSLRWVCDRSRGVVVPRTLAF